MNGQNVSESIHRVDNMTIASMDTLRDILSIHIVVLCDLGLCAGSRSGTL